VGRRSISGGVTPAGRAAAVLYSRVGVKCFLVPPIVGSLQLVVRLLGLRTKDDHPG
jgi:hypothetical protein